MKLKREEFQRIGDASPLDSFKQGIKAQATREKYFRTLEMILCKYLEDFLEGDFEQRTKQLVTSAKKDSEWTRDLLLFLSKKLKERTDLPTTHSDHLMTSSFDNYFKPLKKLFDMNDVAFNWKRIYSTFPEISNISEGRGWARDEIYTMLQHAQGAVDRVIVLFAASSGMRIGGFDLNWEDIIPVYKIGNKLKIEILESEVDKAEVVCAMVIVYRGTNSQYPAFITPEAYFALIEYMRDWSLQVGREPKPKEPIFKIEGPFPKRASTASIKKRVERMVKKAGLKKPLNKGQRRHDVPTMNGFRRFWNKTCKESLSKDSPLASFIKKEFMMGHSGMFKLDKNYFKTQVLELAQEYVDVVPNLTISNESRLRAEKMRLLKEKEEYENEQFANIKKEVAELKIGIRMMRDWDMIKNEKDEERRMELAKEFALKYKIDPDSISNIEFVPRFPGFTQFLSDTFSKSK